MHTPRQPWRLCQLPALATGALLSEVFLAWLNTCLGPPFFPPLNGRYTPSAHTVGTWKIQEGYWHDEKTHIRRQKIPMKKREDASSMDNIRFPCTSYKNIIHNTDIWWNDCLAFQQILCKDSWKYDIRLKKIFCLEDCKIMRNSFLFEPTVLGMFADRLSVHKVVFMQEPLGKSYRFG